MSDETSREIVASFAAGGGSVFANAFTLRGLRHTRRGTAPNPNRLTIERNQSMNDPKLLGKFALQVFSDRAADKLYVRLYHFDTRQAAWYDVADEGTPFGERRDGDENGRA